MTSSMPLRRPLAGRAAPAPAAPAPPPAGRDLGIDAYRAFAMFVVVAWHWVFTIATWGPRGLRVDNPISFLPELGYLTWVLQVMPLFFLVGGHVATRSLAGRSPAEVASWTRRRLTRLAAPAVPLLAGLAVAYLVTSTLGASTLARAVLLTATPMWFLGVYVAIVAVVPLVHRVARRHPVGHVVGLAAFCVLWDVGRFGGWIGGGWVWVSMLTVWLTVHQLGGLLDRAGRRAAWTALAVGLTALVVATGVGPYPVSMVGTTTDRISNMGPPTAVLLALGLVQFGIVVLSRSWVTAVAARHRRVVEAAARLAMPVYLWHMVGFAACVVAVHFVGPLVALELHSEPTASWWLTRPLWVLGPALVARPLVRWSAGPRPLRAPSSGDVRSPG